ncbi:hypothetical protein E6Q11_02235 [Candidatus Dojkabacteria bacterium]|uniref:Tip attachment protein J domain-containing protein n=1 Tax=Candidatus Dojkabacteria bacterium TaxID=2099670 RepID=A0A5C7J9I5_9BACT|nr:MAG: hypothetical protein E6Q11_02235 [Candidatus Dojkabacteria bacterium]
MTRQIIGSKGGGGGSSFITKPDTLRSNDSFEILLGLGSGRWKGLVNGLKSLRINDIPMENADGTSNFQDIYAIFADGNPLVDQMVSFKLGGGASSTTVNTQLANPNTSGPGPWVSGASPSLGVNFIDLRFVVQQLYYQDTKGIRENTANIEIEMRPSGTSTWINPFAAPLSNTTEYDPNGYDYNDPEFGGAYYTAYLGRGLFNPSGIGFRASASNYVPITGKTSSSYVKELRIAVPNTGAYANKSWEVRARLVEKDTVDNGDIQERRLVAFESIAGVSNAPVGDHPDWDGLVWLQLHGKASDQFSGFPEIVGDFDTKICKVPPLAVFNPDTRAYTATTWAGDYVEAFTTDPAWQIKEFVEDPIHGIAGLQPGATVDKWDALEASKYYSELVPDGKGGTHPRFNMNLTITEARDIDEMMNYLAGAVNSYMEDVGGGVWRLKVDKPETPVMLFTPDNIFGDFNYSHTDVDNRFNDWRGTFLDEDLGYQVNTARVFDQDDIDLNGIKFTEVALVGCTNHQEALRRLMFRMRVSLNEYKIVSFQTNKAARYLSPLNTILVADAALNTDELTKSTSRIDSYSGTSVTLKRPVRLEIGVNYQMHFTTIDKKTVVRNVTNGAGASGDVTAISIDSALPTNILPESAVALQAVGLPANPLSYRVIGIERSEDDEDTYTVIASIIDSGKWNAMDNVSAEELAAQESNISIDSPTAPAGGMFDTLEYATDLAMKKVLQVNWNRPAGNYLEGYRVEYNINNGPYRILSNKLTDSIIELENPEDGLYTFKIIALDRRGVESAPLVDSFELNGDRIFTAPTHLRGTLAARPATAPYEGFRYTVSDANPPVTQVWEGGSWVNETNLVTEGSQIGVENGATVGMTAAETIAFNDLVATYGTTVSAAAAKVAAEAAAANAAADEALAEAHKNAAAASATSANGSATTATGQATIATNQASAAATSATVSAAYAGNRALTPNAEFQSNMALWYGSSAEAGLFNGAWNATYNAGLGVWTNNVGQTTNVYSKLIPVNTSRKYKIRGRIYSTGHSGQVYVGATSHDAAGNAIGVNTGHNYFTGWAGNTKAAGWHDIESPVLTGEGADADTPNWFRAGTKQIRILASLNYNIDPSQVFGLDSLWLEDVTETELATSQASISTSQAAAATAAASTATTQASLASTYNSQALATKLAVDAIEGNVEFNRGFDGWSRDITGNFPGETYPASAYVGGAWEGGNYLIFPANVYGEVFTTKAFDVDPNRTYRITANYGAYRTGASSDTARFYIGFAGLNAAGTPVDHGAYGTYRYCITHGVGTNNPQVVQDGYRYEASVVVTGSGNDSWNKFPPGTAKVKLLALMNSVDGVQTRNVASHLGYIKIEDITESVLASTQASIATTQATVATAQAAAAQSNAMLSANVAVNALNKNSRFTIWDDPLLYPAEWINWVTGTGIRTRIAGAIGGYALREQVAAGQNMGIQCTPAGTAGQTGGWFVLTAEVTLEAGDLIGSAMYINRSVGGGFSFPLSGEIDPITGTSIGAGTVGRKYRISRIFQLAAGTNVSQFILMTGWEGGYAGVTAKTLTWHEASIREATPAEIRDQTVLAPMEATVATNTSAIATLNSSVATLNSTVSTQGVTISSQQTAITTLNGNVTTLFGRASVKVDVNGRVTGWETNNNGTTGDFIIHADNFQIVKPGGGSRTEFANGCWKIYDGSTLRIKLGNLAA